MKYAALSLLATLTALPSLALADSKPIWNCSNTKNVEAAGIAREANGNLSGGVSWDCWPGGGICGASTRVYEGRDNNGDVVYRGRDFWLIIHTSAAPIRGEYKAHLIAVDTQDPVGSGRGFQFNEFLTCSSN